MDETQIYFAGVTALIINGLLGSVIGPLVSAFAFFMQLVMVSSIKWIHNVRFKALPDSAHLMLIMHRFGLLLPQRESMDPSAVNFFDGLRNRVERTLVGDNLSCSLDLLISRSLDLSRSLFLFRSRVALFSVSATPAFSCHNFSLFFLFFFFFFPLCACGCAGMDDNDHRILFSSPSISAAAPRLCGQLASQQVSAP
jgi:hypothetical protein